MNAGQRFSILRIRPASAEPEGPRHERLEQLIRILDANEPGEHKSETIPVALDASPFDEVLVARIARAIESHFEFYTCLLIDFCYDRTIECYGFLEWLLYRAIAEAEKTLPANRQLYIFLDVLPTEGERLFLLGPSVNDGDGRVTFIDREGEFLLASEDIDVNTADLGHLVDSISRDLPSLFDRRMLRRRGAFRSSRSSTPETLYRYQYHVRGSAGSRELAELLITYFEQHSISSVLFTESLAEAWMEPAISFASDEVGASWASVASLESEDEAIEEPIRPIVREVRASLASPDDEICLVLPAFRDGDGYLRLAEICAQYNRTNFHVLAVIMDSDAITNYVLDTPDWFGTVELPLGATRARINYLVKAPIVALEPGTWEYEAAIVGEFAEDGHDTVVDPSPDVHNLAVWSLLSDYPVAAESPLPGARPAVAWFPLLGSLDRWDATWLAWVLLTKIVHSLKCHPSQLLIVMPSEPNASAPLSVALEQRLGVAVVSLARDVINGDAPLPEKDRNLISDFRLLKVACLDESLIGGATLRRLNEIVKTVRDRDCNVAAVLLSAGESELDPITVFAWKPYLWLDVAHA